MQRPRRCCNAGEQERSSQSGAGSPLGSAAANSTGTAKELTDILGGMTPAERAAYLLSNEFQDWALRNPEAAKPRRTQRLILG